MNTGNMNLNGFYELFSYYSDNSNLEQVTENSNHDQYIFKYKNGSKIHIKKQNKGKFTDYCGGKVTNECIQKGRNSTSSVIRKRATFAANARKWKH